jgi:hypothetical protein
LKKRIAGALVVSLLIGSVPGWAEGENATKPTAEEGAQRQQFRASIDRAVDRATEGERAQGTPSVVPNEPQASGPQLTARERRDLDARRAALQTDPVARGAGGVVLILLGLALSIGLTIYLVDKAKKDNNTTTTAGVPAMSR